MSSPESQTVVKGARRSLRLAKAARRSGRGGGKARILESAGRLFAARDFSDISMQDVASDAGVTKAALYALFLDGFRGVAAATDLDRAPGARRRR